MSPCFPAPLAERYRLIREVARGGMATVYLARDVKHGRDVAVKVVHPSVAATLGAARFLREIEIAAQLHHPHIVPFFDSGEAGGALYYVMPYEAESSLRERLARDGPLSSADIVLILATSATPWHTRMGAGSFTATSSRTTCSSPAATR